MADLHGIELSFDNAVTWKILKQTTDQINTICPGPNNKPTTRVVYWNDPNSSYQKIYCSKDGGRTIFSEYSVGIIGNNCIAVSQSEPSVAYAGDTLLYKTIDYGVSWEQIADLGPFVNGVHQIAVDPLDSDHVVVSATGGYAYVLVSSDGFATWDIAWNPTSGYTAYARGAAVSGDGGLYAAVWTAVGGVGTERAKVLSVNSGGATEVYAGTPVQDEEDCSHWMASAYLGQIRMLCVGNPSVSGGLLLSPDRGATWSEIHSADLPPPGYSDRWSRCALSGSGSILYVSVEEVGLYKSTDKGVTWTNIFTYRDDIRMPCPVVADPAEEKWVWLLASKTGSDYPGIYLSKDAGVTWRKKRTLAAFPATNLGYSLDVAYEAVTV
jgi:hypothetical protein